MSYTDYGESRGWRSSIRVLTYPLTAWRAGGHSWQMRWSGNAAGDAEPANPLGLRWLMAATEHSCHGPPTVILWFCYNHTFSSAPRLPLPQQTNHACLPSLLQHVSVPLLPSQACQVLRQLTAFVPAALTALRLRPIASKS